MKILQIALLMIAAVMVLRVAPAHAQQAAPTAREHVAQAQVAFDKGDYKAALDHYERAFALDSTPANALRVFVASAYVNELSVATKLLETWFVKKRSDAQKLGDNEESWKIIDTVATSLRGAASRQEAKAKQLTEQVDKLTKQIAKLEADLKMRDGIIQSIKVGYERDIADLKSAYRKQLETANAFKQGSVLDKSE